MVKPTAGMFDLATRTAEGIANTFDFLEESAIRGESGEERVRPPRMMHGPEHALRPYSRSEAIAQRILLHLRDGCFLNEALHMCVQLSQVEILVLTERRILLASASTFKTMSQYPLLAIQAVRTHADRHAIELQLKLGTNRSMTGAPARSRWRPLFKHAPAAAASTSNGVAEWDADDGLVDEVPAALAAWSSSRADGGKASVRTCESVRTSDGGMLVSEVGPQPHLPARRVATFGGWLSRRRGATGEATGGSRPKSRPAGRGLTEARQLESNRSPMGRGGQTQWAHQLGSSWRAVDRLCSACCRMPTLDAHPRCPPSI